MRPSSATRALLDDLALAAGARPGLFAAIGRRGEVAAIPALLPWLLGTRVADHAARAVAQILGVAPVAGWWQLEQTRGVASVWSRLAAPEVELLGRIECGWAALAMASMHADGRVRAAAVAMLVGRNDGGWPALASLLLRLNDWAAPIRTMTRAAIAARLTAEPRDAWVDVLPLVLSLAHRRRDDHGWLITAVEAMLREPAAQPAVRRGSNAPDPAVRLACVRVLLAVDDGGWDRRYLFETEPSIRRGLAELLRALPDGPRWPELAALALRHRERVIRRIAHAAVMARPAAVQRAVFERLLVDRRLYARQYARGAMRALDPGFDMIGWYRDAIGRSRDPVALATAIQGYGECEGALEDAVLVQFLKHGKNRVKAAANIAISMIARRRGG